MVATAVLVVERPALAAPDSHRAAVNLLLVQRAEPAIARHTRPQADGMAPGISGIVGPNGAVSREIERLGGTALASFGPNLSGHLDLDQGVTEIRANQVSTQNDSSAQSSAPTPTSVIPTADFTVQEIRVQSKEVFGAPPLRSSTVAARMYVVIYWHSTNVPTGQRPEFAYTATRRGKVVAKSSFTGGKPSYPAGNYSASFPLKLKKAGSYTITGTVTIGSTAHSSTLSVAVKPGKR